MLQLNIKPTYRWPVKFLVAADGPDGAQEVQFNAEFNRVGRSRVNELMAAWAKDEPLVTDDELLTEVWVGWDINGTDSVIAPFTDEAIAVLFELTGAKEAVVSAWFESMTVGKLKN